MLIVALVIIIIAAVIITGDTYIIWKLLRRQGIIEKIIFKDTKALEKLGNSIEHSRNRLSELFYTIEKIEEKLSKKQIKGKLIKLQDTVRLKKLN